MAHSLGAFLSIMNTGAKSGFDSLGPYNLESSAPTKVLLEVISVVLPKWLAKSGGKVCSIVSDTSSVISNVVTTLMFQVVVPFKTSQLALHSMRGENLTLELPFPGDTEPRDSRDWKW